MIAERRTQHGHAWIIDNRNGSKERVGASGHSVHSARANAYQSAVSACDERNPREGWQRFVAVTWDAGYALGIDPANRPVRCPSKEAAG